MSGSETQELQRLLEAMNRKKNSVSAEDLRRFVHRPQGPIMPGECLRVERHEEKIYAIFANAEGKLCYVTKNDHFEPIVVVADEEIRLAEIGTIVRGDVVAILGLDPACQPVLGIARQQRQYICVGDKISDSAVCGSKKELQAVTLLRDGRLMYVESCNNELSQKERAYVVRMNGKVCGYVNHGLDSVNAHQKIVSREYMPAEIFISKFLCDADGNIFVLARRIERPESSQAEFSKLFYLYRFNQDGQFELVSGEENWSLLRIGVNDVVWDEKEKELLAIRREPDGVSVEVLQGGGVRSTEIRLCRDYISSGRILSDHKFACIASAQNGNVAWCANDIPPQPAFEHVSPLFRRGDKWCYYGSIDKHIFTMELPGC